MKSYSATQIAETAGCEIAIHLSSLKKSELVRPESVRDSEETKRHKKRGESLHKQFEVLIDQADKKT